MKTVSETVRGLLQRTCLGVEDFGTRPLPVEAQDLHDGLMSGACVSSLVSFNEGDWRGQAGLDRGG